MGISARHVRVSASTHSTRTRGVSSATRKRAGIAVVRHGKVVGRKLCSEVPAEEGQWALELATIVSVPRLTTRKPEECRQQLLSMLASPQSGMGRCLRVSKGNSPPSASAARASSFYRALTGMAEPPHASLGVSQGSSAAVEGVARVFGR